MMATIDELRQKPHWSYSALNTYLNVCQLQYFYRYVEQPEIERTSVCLPFGKAFHAALTAQAWECLMGSSLTREEIVNLFAESFKIETEIAPNLIYKEGDRQPLCGVVQNRNRNRAEFDLQGGRKLRLDDRAGDPDA